MGYLAHLSSFALSVPQVTQPGLQELANKAKGLENKDTH